MNGLVRLATLAVVVAVLVATAPLAGNADTGASLAGAPALTVTKIQPTEGDAVVVERVAAGKEYMSEEWRLVMDIWLQNDGPDTLHLESVVVRYDDGIPPHIGLGQDLDIESGGEGKVLVPDDRTHQFPLPESVTVELLFSDEDDAPVPFSVTAPLAVYANQPSPMGSYRFPGMREDLDALGENCYWAAGSSHGTFEKSHRESKTQRFAYDLGAACWSEERQAWSGLRDGTDGSENEDYVIFGLPIYAMADGTVYACTRDQPENEVGVGGPDGNGFAIQHGVDEYVNYAHMQQWSITEELCVEGATVVAGQYLGKVGNTGSSSQPHFHTHAQRGVTGVEPHDGRPQLFHNIRVLEVGPEWNWFAPPVDDLPWHTTNGAAPGRFMLIDPLPFSDPPSGPGDVQGGIVPIDPVGVVEPVETPDAETPDPEPTTAFPIGIVAIPAEPSPTVPSSSVPLDPSATCPPEPEVTPEATEEPLTGAIVARTTATPPVLRAPNDGC